MLLDLIEKTFRKAGVEEDTLKTLFNIPSLAEVKVDKEVIEKVDALMTEDIAINNNPKVKNAIIAKFTKSEDHYYMEALKELGVPKEVIEKVSAIEASGTKKKEGLKEAVKWMEEKTKKDVQANLPPDDSAKEIERIKAEYNEKIKDLNGQLADTKNTWQSEVENLNSSHKKTYNRMFLMNDLANNGYEWKDDIPKKHRGELGAKSYEEKLNQLGGGYTVENDAIKLFNAQDPSMDLTGKDHLPLTHKKITDMIMAEEGFVKTKEKPQTPTSYQPPENQQTKTPLRDSAFNRSLGITS